MSTEVDGVPIGMGSRVTNDCHLAQGLCPYEQPHDRDAILFVWEPRDLRAGIWRCWPDGIGS